MALTFTKTTVLGNLVSDLTLRKTNRGLSVTNGTVITNKIIQIPGGGIREKRISLKIRAWGDLAEGLAGKAKKGSLIFLEGEIDQSVEGPISYYTIEISFFRIFNNVKEYNPENIE